MRLWTHLKIRIHFEIRAFVLGEDVRVTVLDPVRFGATSGSVLNHQNLRGEPPLRPVSLHACNTFGDVLSASSYLQWV